MASFLKDMFFVIVERVTGYVGRAQHQEDATGAQVPNKLASVSRVQQKVAIVQQSEIRTPIIIEDPVVSAGSKPQVTDEGA
ncbi:unnamed protein product [Urochloa decumbens]|uniref:Uncharacterized protein n=1 Tax=Urochloa decumbens TaxID=240449 RepID=A0ABC9D231_9POAL